MFWVQGNLYWETEFTQWPSTYIILPFVRLQSKVQISDFFFFFWEKELELFSWELYFVKYLQNKNWQKYDFPVYRWPQLINKWFLRWVFLTVSKLKFNNVFESILIGTLKLQFELNINLTLCRCSWYKYTISESRASHWFSLLR